MKLIERIKARTPRKNKLGVKVASILGAYESLNKNI